MVPFDAVGCRRSLPICSHYLLPASLEVSPLLGSRSLTLRPPERRPVSLVSPVALCQGVSEAGHAASWAGGQALSD